MIYHGLAEQRLPEPSPAECRAFDFHFLCSALSGKADVRVSQGDYCRRLLVSDTIRQVEANNMFRLSSSLLKAATALTYVRVDDKREEMIDTITNFFIKDIEKKGLTIPEYVKEPFALTAKTADDKVAGSCCGYSVWGALHINMFAVNPEVTVPGTGKVLMRAMEELAHSRGSHRMDLDTYSWQARPFYEKCGYTVFGTSKNYPKGHERYFMEKLFKEGAAMDPAPYALTGASAAAQSLKVVDGDVEKVEVELDHWLNFNTQSRKIEGVGPYIKKEYGIEARLPDGSLGAATLFETLWGELHISYFGCNDAYLGQGIGSQFMKHIEGVAREMGCYRLCLETMSWQAKAFYEKHGFKEFGYQDNLPIKGTGRHYMEKVLE